MLPFEKIATFFERASEVSGDDCLGFRFAHSRDVRDAGLLGYIGLSSPTVLAALRNLERYSRVFSDAIEFSSDNLEETGILSWRFRASATVYQRQFTEFSLTNVVQTFRSLTGRPLIPVHVAFSHPRNSRLKDFDGFFGCESNLQRRGTKSSSGSPTFISNCAPLTTGCLKSSRRIAERCSADARLPHHR